MSTKGQRDIRIEVGISVKIFGVSGGGQAFSGDATVVNLSKHGACLTTDQWLEPGQILLLETLQAGILDTEVIWIGDPCEGALRSVGVHRHGLGAAFGYSIPP